MYLRQMREMLELLGELTTESISPQAEADLLGDLPRLEGLQRSSAGA